jgi:predicted ATPase with chaperone activity
LYNHCPIIKITVNLAPADLPKESGRFDLPIALGVLAATGQIPTAVLTQYEFAGELALTGALRPNRGALPMTLYAHRDGRAFVPPAASACEASLVRDAVGARKRQAVRRQDRRIDLGIEVPAVEAAAPCASAFPSDGNAASASSARVREEATRARSHQTGRQGKPNARLAPREIDAHCAPDSAGAALLAKAMARLSLSARISPHPQGRAHDRRPRGLRHGRRAARRRGDRVAAVRPVVASP